MVYREGVQKDVVLIKGVDALLASDGSVSASVKFRSFRP